jgi:heptosyltransferase-1
MNCGFLRGPVVNVLALNTANVGDVVSSLVVAQALTRDIGPIDFCARPAFASLFDSEPHYNYVDVPTALSRTYDLVVDLDSSTQSRKIVSGLRARRKVGRYKGWLRRLKMLWTYSNLVPKFSKDHIVRDYYPVLKVLGYPEGGRPELNARPNPEVSQFMKSSRGSSGQGILIHFGAHNPIRRLPNEWLGSYILKCRDAGIGVVLSYTPSDDIESLVALCDNYPRYRPLNLDELKSALVESGLFVAADSGPLHIATALNVKSLGFYGPTLARNYGLIGDTVIPLEKDFVCRPCNQNKPCPYSRRCLMTYTPEEVFSHTRAALESV